MNPTTATTVLAIALFLVAAAAAPTTVAAPDRPVVDVADSLAADTTPPTANATANRTTIVEGLAVGFDGSNSTDDTNISSYDWEFGDGNVSTGQTAAHRYMDPGNYTVNLTVTDGSGNTDTTSLTVNVSQDTTLPVPVIQSTTQSEDEDQPIGFDALSSTDDGHIVEYEWTFNTSSSGPVTKFGETQIFTWSDPCSACTVELRVTDAGGNVNSTSIFVSIADVTPPNADAGPDATVDEDTIVSFDGTGSTDNGNIRDYRWEFGDGTNTSFVLEGSGGAIPSHSYAQPGTYVVNMTVRDDALNTANDSLTVTVRDVTPPTADAGPDRTVNEDAATSFDATASTDNVGVTGFSWDLGDGNATTGATPSHTYSQPGIYAATVTASDAAGNTDTATVNVTVEDVTPPTADAGSNASTTEGVPVSLDGTGSTDNVGVTGFSWDLGDGNATTGTMPSHTYASPGTYTLTLTTTDAAGNVDTDTATVTVAADDPPTAEAGRGYTVDVDATVTFDGSGSTDDLGVVSYDWAFPGGSASGPTARHTFRAPGTYTVTLTVTDAAGQTDADTTTVVVRAPDTATATSTPPPTATSTPTAAPSTPVPPATPTPTPVPPTPTATPIVTPTDAPATATPTAAPGTTDAPADDGIPGFGPAAALGALVAGSLLAARREW